ncbi:MAG: glucose 1-dehydrogenase [Sedimentisphaerales bacterium]|nr:glucose 1-dehydrogenase [Sedimentisphaerales bacterium]
MEQRLIDKVAIVTGSGHGIGKAVALRLAHEGADIIIADIDIKSAEQTAREILDAGRKATAYSIDLANVSQIQPMVEQVVDQFVRIDILVNAAGIAQTKPFFEITEDQWDRVLDTNLKGTVFCIQAVAAQMIKQIPEEIRQAGRADKSYGKIVNFSSISGRRGRALQIAYAASKAAIISITQSAALALSAYNINVNAVAPSVVPTGMWEQIDEDYSRILGKESGQSMKDFIEQIPLKRAGNPKDIAAAVTFLCSCDSDYITGQTLNVDGGFEMD